MKINKSILTGITALALFATGAATATSSMTSVTANASAHKHVRKAHKRAKKYVFKYNWLFKVESKGHKTFYYNTVDKSPKITLHQARTNGWSTASDPEPGYKMLNPTTTYGIGKHNKHVYVAFPWITTFVNKKHTALRNSEWLGQGTHRVSKAHFNRLYHDLRNYNIKGTF